MQPLVSIVINSYNYQKFVGQAIDSVIKQSYQNIEIIIVDDASTDASPELLMTYQKKYPEKIVKLELLSQNIGVGKAANLGMSFANGQYISFFSSDDRMHPDKIARQVEYLERNKEVAAVFSWAKYIDAQGAEIMLQNEIFNIPVNNIPLHLLTKNFILAPSVMIRTDVVKKLNGFNCEIKYVQDYDLWIRVLQNHEISIISEKLVEYRIHGKNLSFFADNTVPFAARYETVSCIIEAINTWPLEKIYPVSKTKFINSPDENTKEQANLLAKVSEHCLNIDQMYFGKPFLATNTAYRLVLKGLVLDPDSVQCRKIITKVYDALGDYKRSKTGYSINFEEWRKDNNHVSDLTIQDNKNTSKSAYSAWRDRHRWSTSAVARLAEQVAPSLESGVGVHLLMVAAADDNNAIADTIDTLAAQGSAGWRLTVLSPDPCPNPLFETEATLAWVQITTAEELPSALNQAVALSPVDWFMVCAPGIRFEPPFVSLVLATSAQHPDWCCVYFDEERINRVGQMTDPRLKPDANLELLYSSAYVGQAVLTHRALWPVLNLYFAAMPRAFAFDAALRAIESGGTSALGHIDELAVALPETADGASEEWVLIAKPLLEGHLQRTGVIANVNDGYLPATFFVDYALTTHPLVSIIIPTRNRFDLLQPCIESLLDKTRYSNYELIIIDNLSDDSATLKYFSYLKAHDQRIKIILYPKEYNYSAINNFAARQANGDFILFLNNDTVVLQENWLERLVSIGLRDDVGVVGCRLVYTDQRVQHAGVIIGLGGVAEHIGIGLPMSETRYMGRAQLTQNFSAVTAACMLVRKSLFFDVGGLDEKDFSVLYNDIDLCLKVREQGYRIVWTPFVTLIHHGNSSLKANPDPKRDERGLLSRKAFIKKWFPCLGKDPTYNRHLSLRQREWMIDGDFDVPWHPDFEPLPRIVAQPPDEMGVGQYRMIGPLKALTDSGRVTHFLLPPLNSEKRFLPFLSELSRAKPTVLFFQNAFTQLQTDDLQAYAELLPDVFRVFGQDDIVFSIPQKSAARKHFGKDTKARVRKAVSLCHRAIVTTEPIAEALRGMADDIRVVPNYLERSRWGDLQPPRKERRKLRVGWAGAQQHQGDLEFILPVVEATANEVDWIFMGLCPPKLRYHVAEAHNAVPFDQYPAALAALDLDLAIAPLEINRFNVAKSNLRLLEYGAVGYPVICTDIEPYRNAPVACVPNNSQAWIDAIRAHVHEVDATRAAGEQLREWVLSNWMLDQHLNEWLKALLPD